MEQPFDGHIGLAAAFLENFHGDPANRMITATALVHGSMLLTADKKNLEWEELEKCGEMIGINDLHIAGHARSEGLSVKRGQVARRHRR